MMESVGLLRAQLATTVQHSLSSKYYRQVSGSLSPNFLIFMYIVAMLTSYIATVCN